MTSVSVALIGVDSALNVLRWLALAFLCFLVILLFVKSKKLETKKPAIIALSVTIIAAPFLILNLISTKVEPNKPAEPVNPTPVEPIPDREPEPEPEPEPEEIDPISYITPATPKKRTPRKQSDGGKSDDTTPVVPDIPVQPDEVIATAYLVINRKMDIEGEKFDVEEVEKFDGTPGDTVTAAVKNYKGFTAPTAETFTLQEDTRKMVVYDYNEDKLDEISFKEDLGGTLTDNETEFGWFARLNLPLIRKETYKVGFNSLCKELWTLPKRSEMLSMGVYFERRIW